MKTIYKYELSSKDASMKLPKGAEILSVAIQDGRPMLWALVDPENVLEDRFISTVGTGWELEDNMKYICTYMEGYFVWHVFEMIQ
jgi:hypothetical protein